MKILIASLLVASVGLTACGNRPPATNANTQTTNTNPAPPSAAQPKDDLDGLALVIKMPFEPLDGVWKEEEFVKPAGASKKLTAVLLFSKEDAAKIVAQSAGYRPASNEVLTPEGWYPSELVAQSQTSADKTIKGVAYGANDFANAPYTEGRIVRVDGTDYFIVELYAK